MRLSGFDEPRVNHLKIVTEWLNDESSGRWLLILDNVDDKGFASSSAGDLSNMSKFTLPEYLPRKRGCYILITSRDHQAALNLVGDRSAIIPATPMTDEEAVELFRVKTLGVVWDAVQAHHLATQLECLPLLITQAAAYIMARQRMTVGRYLELFQCDEERLLRETQNDWRRDVNVPNSVIKSWQVSFRQIYDQHLEAAQLLFTLCFIDRKRIPVWLLLGEGDDSEALNEAIETLLRFSFIKMISRESDMFEMHRLVQVVTKIWLRARNELEMWNHKALQLIQSRYPDDGFRNWKTCQLLEPHAETAIASSYVGGELVTENSRRAIESPSSEVDVGKRLSLSHQTSDKIKDVRGVLLYNRTMYAHQQARYGKAVELAQLARCDLCDLLGEDDPDVLRCGHVLAESHLHAGDLEEAMDVASEVAGKQAKVLGPEDWDTLTTERTVAMTYRELGWHEEAAKILIRIVQISSSVSAADQESLLASLNDLAIVLGDQGNWEDKRKFEDAVVRKFAELQGEDHPHTLSAMNNLAQTYRKQGHLERAEAMLRYVINTKRSVMGSEHALTLSSMSGLAMVYYHQSRLREACELQRTVVNVSRGSLSEKHLRTITHVMTLARILRNMGKTREAIELCKGCAEARAIQLGEGHPETLHASSMVKMIGSEQSRKRQLTEHGYWDIVDKLDEAPVPDAFEFNDRTKLIAKL